MWVRGLKHLLAVAVCCAAVSHPMWVRGLKLVVAFASIHPSGRTLCGCVD